MLLFLVSFIAGILTVLAPCVLPLLPVIVGGSLVGGGARRALVIALSLGVSVIVFTLLLKATTALIAIPQAFWDVFSGGILILFGLTMLVPALWDRLPIVNRLNTSSNRLLSAGYRQQSLGGDIIMGAALGPVFSSCSPTYFIILATVLPASFALGIADLLAYAIGLAGFLLVIALAGQRLVDRLGITIDPSGWFRRAIGILFIIVGLGVLTGLEAGLEAFLLDRGFDATIIEQYLLGANQSASTTASEIAQCTGTTCKGTAPLSPALKASLYQKTPELVHPDGYLNTGGMPITIGQFKGKKVVLIDFWTYSCINCIRSIPYVESWYEKYKDEGLVVIGVHTPEFAFEHVKQNVADAIQKLGITYPVVLDNEYQTWNAFGNQFWPREYLIDIDGYIVHDHAGEGDYDATEDAIRQALAERAERLGITEASTTPVGTPTSSIPVDVADVRSPETYFGAARNEFLGNGHSGVAGKQTLTIPAETSANTLYLGGTWNFADEYAESQSRGAEIQFTYDAKHVYFVAAANDPVTIKVLRDGAPVPAEDRGADLNSESEATIHADRLYDLIDGANYGVHTIQIEVERPGLDAYTFTFG